MYDWQIEQQESCLCDAIIEENFDSGTVNLSIFLLCFSLISTELQAHNLTFDLTMIISVHNSRTDLKFMKYRACQYKIIYCR